jgi:hypothetical protein
MRPRNEGKRGKYPRRFMRVNSFVTGDRIDYKFSPLRGSIFQLIIFTILTEVSVVNTNADTITNKIISV